MSAAEPAPPDGAAHGAADLQAIRRRRWLLGGTALSAVGAGIGWSVWRRRAGAPGDDALADLWSLRFPRPEGGELVDSLSVFECRRNAIHDGGDHFILVGEVVKATFEPGLDPLLYFRGRYRRLHFD